METPRHTFRKFVFAGISRTAAGHYTITAPRNGRAFRLEPDELELARLFDGDRDAAAIRDAARRLIGREFSAAELESFANELGMAGLLEPGSREPLPVPPQSDEEAAAAGWIGQRVSVPGPEVSPPSTVPGSLAGPGRSGSLTSLWGAFRGESVPLQVRLPVSPLLPLGRLLGWALGSATAIVILVAAAFAALFALWVNRVAVAHDVVKIAHPLAFTVVAVLGLGLTQFLAEVTRAAAVRSATGVTPRFGLMFGAGLIPFFKADTSGPAEGADRPARLRVIGAGLVSTLTLMLLAVAGWFMFHPAGGLLPTASIGLAICAMVWAFIQINPLARRDGYHLLAQGLDAPDLREQAVIIMFGYQKPWLQSRRLSDRTLWIYGIASFAYVLWMVIWLVLYPGEWLAGSWGSAGVAVFIAAIAWLVYLQVRRVSSQRANIGAEIVVAAPNRIDWLIIGAAVAIALFPYPYEPSGDFVVLPFARADLRAQIAGDVREVLVKEGDAVKAGQVIARLDDSEQRAALASAEADLAHASADLALAKGGARPEEIEEAKQAVATAQKRYEFADAEARRQGEAYRQRAVTEQQYQHFLSDAQVGQQQLLEAKRHLDLIASPAQRERLQSLSAEVAKAQGEVDYRRQQLDWTQIRAPIDGHVVSGSLMFAVGDYLQVGANLGQVESIDRLMVEIHLPETAVDEIAVGDRAYAKAWGMPFNSYPGVVTQIAPAAQSEQDGRVVRVLMQINRPDNVLKPEMTGYAKVSGATYPLIVAFTKPLVRFFLVEIWSWLP